MSFLLALDQGTSSSRSIVFDESGQIVASAQREFRQIFPQPGWVEHDANEIWDSQLATAREAIAKAGLKAADIRAIGITNQRETTVLWNRRTGKPVHNAIVWQDRRTEPFCAQLRAQGLEPMVQRATGLRIDPYFSATKLRWLLDHVSGAHIAAAQGELAFGTVDSWLLWKLTGGALHATDVSNASRTMLFDIRHNVWDHELLKALHIPDSVLPQVFPSSHVYGPTDPGAVRRGHPDRRHRRRPAERALRPGLLQRRAGEEHLRHRLLHADAHRREVPGFAERAHHHRRGADRPHARVRLRGQRVHRRRGGAVAARRACARSRPAPRCRRWPKACPTAAA